MMGRMYQAKRKLRAASLSRSATSSTTCWSGANPAPGKVPLVMVHGWMDVAASYQFMVDAFAQDHYVIAPDWRGYGLTESPPDRQLLVSRLPGRPRFPARPLFARRAGEPGGPQHGRQRRHAVRRLAARSASAGWSTWKASAWPATRPSQAPDALCQVDGRAQGLPSRRDGAQAL